MMMMTGNTPPLCSLRPSFSSFFFHADDLFQFHPCSVPSIRMSGGLIFCQTFFVNNSF